MGVNLLPEWAPNLHPLIVHFPIALLILAVAVDFAGVFIRKVSWLPHAATLIYVAGALGALAAFLTGRQAADTVNLPALANPTLNEHADLAQWTLIWFGVLALIRLSILIERVKLKLWISGILFLAGVGGLVLLFQTGDRGGRLVFYYGVGVSSLDEYSTTEVVPASGLSFQENGSWKWKPTTGASRTLTETFTWLEGNISNVKAEYSNGDSAVLLEFYGTVTNFLAGAKLTGVQVDIGLNLDDFGGVFSVIHHIQNEETFDFLSLDNGNMVLGRMDSGDEKILQKKAVNTAGWVDIRVVGDGRHFRGYLNETLIIHGHIEELPPGPVGLRVSGKGRVKIKQIEVLSLRQ